MGLRLAPPRSGEAPQSVAQLLHIVKPIFTNTETALIFARPEAAKRASTGVIELDIFDKPHLIEAAGLNEYEECVSIASFADAAIELLHNPEMRKGDPLPWTKTHDKFGFRPGETSLWAGINGHGKSLLMGQIFAWLPADRRILLASMEMPGHYTLLRIVQQCLGTDSTPSDDFVRHVADGLSNLTLFTRDYIEHSDQILALAWYCGQLGYHHIAIDSLVKCGVAVDEFDKQKEFVQRLVQIGKRAGMHTHLVHHVRKGLKEEYEPDKLDIKGAGEITDLVDNILIVHRNKAKEAKLEQGKEVDDLEPDNTLRVAKQRHGNWEGRIALYKGAGEQFHSGPDQRKMEWRA